MRDEGSLRKAGITAMAAVGAAVYLLGSSVKEAGREPAGDMGQPWGAERQSFFPGFPVLASGRFWMRDRREGISARFCRQETEPSAFLSRQSF